MSSDEETRDNLRGELEELTRGHDEGQKSSRRLAKTPTETSTEGNVDTFNVVKSIADSLSLNFQLLNDSLTRNFTKLGDNLQQVVHDSMVVEGLEEESTSSYIGEPGEIANAEKVAEEQQPETNKTDSVPSRLLASLERKTSNSEKTGPKINDSLALNVTKLMRQKPEEGLEKEFLDQIYRPENCAGLSQIKVNQVIWDRVPAEARTTDLKMQRVQNSLVKGATNVALIADLILNAANDKDGQPQELLDKIWKVTENALVCLGSANWELAQRRKEALKPHIARDYSHLCSQKVAVTEMLFGDDITKQIKDITDDNKVTHKVMEAKKHKKTYSRFQYRSKQEGSYKGYGGGRARTNPYSRPFLERTNQYRPSYYQKGKTMSTSTETSTKK